MSVVSPPVTFTVSDDPANSPNVADWFIQTDPETQLTNSNHESEFLRAALANSIDTNSSDYNDFVEWIRHDASAFNLSDGDAWEAALSAESLTIADLDTYAAAYIP